MPVPLKDIPRGQLTPDEVEALANETFDYADRERVSLREAERIRKENQYYEDIGMGFRRAKTAEEFRRGIATQQFTIEPGYGEFTTLEKTGEILKSIHRGSASVVKMPGVALKALGETAVTRAEIEALKESPSAFDRFRAGIMESPQNKRSRAFADTLRRAGNKYIDTVNELTWPESRKSVSLRTMEPFSEAPIYRTLMAIGESGPSYGIAVATTLSTGSPNAGLAVIGASATSSAYENYRQRNVGPDLALLGALTEGSIEVLTEKVPMDMLMKGAGRPFLIRALKLGTAESFQELLAQLGQNYTAAVIQDVDPENYGSVLQASRQEWSIISQGWQDAMAAGFLMGSGADIFTGGQPQIEGLRTADELRAEYGFVPRNTPELLSLMEQVKTKVKDVERTTKEPETPAKPAAKTAEKAPERPVEARTPPSTAQTAPKIATGQIQAKPQAEGKKTLLDNLNPEERTELESLEQQLKAKLVGQLNVGLDPEVFTLATKVGGFYVKAGYRAFSQWAAAVRKRIGNISDYTLRTIYASLREQNPNLNLDTDEQIDAYLEIGQGEEKPRGTSVSVMAQAIESELVEEHKAEDIPVYRAMNMKEQADKALSLIEMDIEKARRVAFYKETAPVGLYPENVFSALRIYAKMNADVDLLMDLALNEDVVREHTIIGKRIKSLDTDQDYADPISAIREVVNARKEQMARQGKDISALEAKLRELQTQLDKATKARTEFTKRAARTYGTRNKLVSRAEYDTIIARRRQEAAALKSGRSMGAAYVPNAQDFIDIGKIAAFHLEAMGRDFAKWSYQMTRDFGDWITPYLKDEYDKALAEAQKAGVEIKESKRLTTKKKRLATTTKKITGKLEELDLEKAPRIPIELDEEGQRLQDEYDRAREQLKAAQAVANIITEEEVRIIAQLSKEAADRKAIMEQSERRKPTALQGTETERVWGVAVTLFNNYVNGLKQKAAKKGIKQAVLDYLTDPLSFISDLFGIFKTARASYDNSFIGKQGRKVLYQGLTGDIKSLRIWVNTLVNSFVYLIDPLRHNKALMLLGADIISDPDFELLKQSKVAISLAAEEELPVKLGKIPLVGLGFKMSESAYMGSARFMRYAIAKKYIDIWRKSGRELTKRELLGIGSLTNSQTGRGGLSNQRPGWINNIFWSPRMILGDLNYLTIHLFDKNTPLSAKKQAAINLLRFISGAGMILALADWIDDDSVTWDTNSSDFGKIRIGNTRWSVGGGLEVLIVLASRIITGKYTSSTTGKVTSTNKYMIWNFVENKLSPGASIALALTRRKTREGEDLTALNLARDTLTPLSIQSVFEAGSVEEQADLLAVILWTIIISSEAMGVNVQTYSSKKGQTNKRKRKL